MINYRNARMFCHEDIAKIENYQEAVNDPSETWHCHHRLEVQGQFRNSMKLLKRCRMYYSRPASELIFLREAEHLRLHLTGKSLSNETKRRISEKKRGKDTLSLEARHNMSASLTNRQDMSTPVEMTRISDGFTKVFPSQQEAVRWLRLNGYPKATSGRVSECANGRRATAYNAKWRII